MQAEMQNVFRELFAQSCHELFVSLDCQIAHCALVEDMISGSPTSVIDAGSEDIELNLVMRMPYAVLAMTYPVPGENIQSVTDVQLEDWLSELGNLLMGRIKAKLIKHRCEVALGLPSIYFGGEIEVPELDGRAVRFDFPFELDLQLCECLLDVTVFNTDMDFSLEEDAEVSVLNEGEIELF